MYFSEVFSHPCCHPPWHRLTLFDSNNNKLYIFKKVYIYHLTSPQAQNVINIFLRCPCDCAWDSHFCLWLTLIESESETKIVQTPWPVTLASLLRQPHLSQGNEEDGAATFGITESARLLTTLWSRPKGSWSWCISSILVSEANVFGIPNALNDLPYCIYTFFSCIKKKKETKFNVIEVNSAVFDFAWLTMKPDFKSRRSHLFFLSEKWV